MNKKIFQYFDMAYDIAINRDDARSFLVGCVAVRRDGAVVKSANTSSQYPDRAAHAEFRVASKIDYLSTVFVSRVKMDGSLGLSRPCTSCLKNLLSRRVKKIFYTISNNSYGVITPRYMFVYDEHIKLQKMQYRIFSTT